MEESWASLTTTGFAYSISFGSRTHYSAFTVLRILGSRTFDQLRGKTLSVQKNKIEAQRARKQPRNNSAGCIASHTLPSSAIPRADLSNCAHSHAAPFGGTCTIKGPVPHTPQLGGVQPKPPRQPEASSAPQGGDEPARELCACEERHPQGSPSPRQPRSGGWGHPPTPPPPTHKMKEARFML